MICSYLVNLSLLIGAVLSWGVMWPLLSELKGKWYPLDIPESSMKSLQGYKVHFDFQEAHLSDSFIHSCTILFCRFSSPLPSFQEMAFTIFSKFLLSQQEACLLDQEAKASRKVTTMNLMLRNSLILLMGKALDMFIRNVQTSLVEPVLQDELGT